MKGFGFSAGFPAFWSAFESGALLGSYSLGSSGFSAVVGVYCSPFNLNKEAD